jgi:hypothetical protein
MAGLLSLPMNLLDCFVLINWSSCKKERFLNNTKNNRLRKMTEGGICGDFLSSFTLLLTRVTLLLKRDTFMVLESMFLLHQMVFLWSLLFFLEKPMM